MKYKIAIESGLWVNCECIPNSWIPDTAIRYVGFVDSKREAFGLVMEAITQWYPRFSVINYDEESWRFMDGDNFLCDVMRVK